MNVLCYYCNHRAVVRRPDTGVPVCQEHAPRIPQRGVEVLGPDTSRSLGPSIPWETTGHLFDGWDARTGEGLDFYAHHLFGMQRKEQETDLRFLERIRRLISYREQE